MVKEPSVFEPLKFMYMCYFAFQDWHAPKQQLEELKDIIDSQAVSDCLHENDKDLVWMMRYECRDKHPHALPLVLKSVKWSSHQDVAKVGISV